ncbi:hypothetical protein [Spiroplasma chrysopicola]|uniref:Uncharacterized protein n=1 Tax=Spiroplasma chrysopicola DF-1 TaxID=1276227 RepID=R4U1X6_9MOLU|nr:hypothetical protein [Spiroplasma chrysopicola]AGM25337.1 hypothetical protein SCHRY_v1c07610 [Spiroplasma chrysopicola DF-1]
MKKINFSKKQKHSEQALDKIIEQSKTNLLEETIIIDDDYSIVKDFKDDNIKVIKMANNNFYNENAIDLEQELLKEAPQKKKNRFFKYIFFMILAILIITMITIIIIKFGGK